MKNRTNNLKKIKIYKTLFFATLVFCLVPTRTAFAVGISVSVDRNPVNIKESFKIFFSASDTPDSNPDFSPLEKNFSVLNQGQSSSSTWVNGNYNKTVLWTLDVMAKDAGTINIPAIQFGKDTSKPLQIVVNKAGGNPNDAANRNEDIFLEVETNPEQPYVQSQVIYKIRLYRRVDIAQAELSEPELADAVIEKLGEDSNFNTVVNGVSYQVTERKYAIFPQKSGTVTIKPLTLTAALLTDRVLDFRDFFSSRITKTKRVLSNEVVLNVKPIPASFTGKHWLAAEQLELSQEWSSDIQQLKIGEPVTRTLTIKGLGTTVGQLPELYPSQTDANVKVYPDQPVLNENKLPEGVRASRQEKIALIPNSPGKHTLPAIEVPWLNTKTQKMEVARIPELALNVSGGGNLAPEKPTPQAKPAGEPTTNSNPLTTPQGKGNINPSSQQNMWPWVTLFLGMGWLVNIVYFWQKNRNAKTKEVKHNERIEKDLTLKESVKQLKIACANDDAVSAKNALLAWGQKTFKANNLGTVAAHCNAPLRDEILLLSQILYSNNNKEWQGKKLFQAFSENAAGAKISNKEDDALEPLFRL